MLIMIIDIFYLSFKNTSPLIIVDRVEQYLKSKGFTDPIAKNRVKDLGFFPYTFVDLLCHAINYSNIKKNLVVLNLFRVVYFQCGWGGVFTGQYTWIFKKSFGSSIMLFQKTVSKIS